MRVSVPAAVLVALLSTLACGPAEEPQGPTGVTTTAPSSPSGSASASESMSATPSPGSSASASGGVPADATSAIFPPAAGTVRFTSPEAAATAFAGDYLGMPAPVVGGFQAGDARSGEVEVRSRPEALPSTVLVRQLSDGTWWVLGSAMPNIRLDTPAAGARVTSPLRLTGSALAYEGHVDVELRADGMTAPVATSFVTGGGDVARPFDGSLTFTTPAATHGALLLITRSARDGSVTEFVAIRVAF
jgi:hypothetical protein